MRSYVHCLAMTFVSCLFSVAACNPQTVSSCAEWRQNNLSAVGLVALTQADRPAAERVEGNARRNP
jgi:hypothetical protein